MSHDSEVIELARAKSVKLDQTGGVSLPKLTPKQKKELLGGEIGTAFDMYTRMFAAFSGGDVFEIGEWRVRDLDAMLSRDGTAKALEQVLTLPMRSAAFSFQAADDDTGELDLILEHFASPSEAVASGNLGVTTGPVGSCSPGLRQIIGQMSMASIYRKAFFEKRYIMLDEANAWGSPKILLTDLAWRPPATCEVKRDEHTAKLDGFRQRAWWFFSDPSAAKKRYAKEWGKNFCLDNASLVQGPNGPVPIGKLSIGDEVFAVDGSVTRVTGVYPQGVRPLYRVTFADDTSVDCDIDHRWVVYDRKLRKWRRIGTWRLIKEGIQRKSDGQWRSRFSVPRCKPVQYPERSFTIDPYVMGNWLGDGCIGRTAGSTDSPRIRNVTFSCHDDDYFILEKLERLIAPLSLWLRASSSGQPWWSVRPVVPRGPNKLKMELIRYGVNLKSPDRFIPRDYLEASIEQRLELLRGLMDADGSIEPSGRVTYSSMSERLVDSVVELVQSLGGVVTRCRKKSGSHSLRVYLDENPFSLPRKASRWMPSSWDRKGSWRLRRIVSIDSTGRSSECTCIRVEHPKHVFLTDGFIATSNTGYLDIPKQRAYVYIHGQHRNPLIGTSDMDVPYWVYKQKLKLMFLWWQFLENQSLPKVAAYGADQDQADDNADAIASMRASAVGGFIRPPSGQRLFDIIEASGAGAAQFRDALNFLDNFQTLSVLAGFLNLPSAAMLGRGSYALSESQTDFFNKSRQGVIYEMQESFTRDVIAPIIILNRGPQAAIPRLTSTSLSSVDTAQILSVFSQLITAPALRIPDQFADMMAEKVATIFDLPLDKVAKMINDGAKIRAMNPITDSPIGSTQAGQEAARLAATLDATFTVLQGTGVAGGYSPTGMGSSAFSMDGGVNGGGQSMQEDLTRG